MSSPSPPDSKGAAAAAWVFFVDRSLGGRKVVSALRAVGVTALAHDDRFAPETPDVEWLKAVREEGWVVLSRDKRIRYNPLEKLALANARARAFFLGSSNLTGDEMASAFVAALPKMLRFLDSHTAPFIAKVYRDGEVKAWAGPADLQPPP